jgi:hypothetical protein
MADGQIELAPACPTKESGSAPDQISGLAHQFPPAVPAYDDGREASRFGHLNRLRKLARGRFNLCPAPLEFGNQRAKERHVRRIREVYPETHEISFQLSAFSHQPFFF